MAEISTIARPYAKAAFQFALQHDQLSHWSDMLSFLSVIVKDEPLQAILDNPTRTVAQKTEIIEKVADNKLDKHGLNFVTQIASQGRLSALSAISEQFELLKAEQEKAVDVTITAAFPLSDSERSDLQTVLSKKLGLSINMQSEVDKDLIGGVVIRTGDMVIDASVRGKLAKLSETLNY